MGQLKIIDVSGDKKYFTIIPNMIVNGSSHWEQSLYLVMKRIAGEEGKCYASIRTHAGKMGCGLGKASEKLHKLLKRNWIKHIGYAPGRTQRVRVFKIIDIWHDNVKKYSKRNSSPGEPSEIVPPTEEIVPHRKHNSSPQETKKNYKYKEELIKKKYIDVYVEKFNHLFKREFRVTLSRERKLKIRLKNYTFKEILKALDNLSQSPWHRGVNDRGWTASPDFLIRNDEQVDKWLNEDIDEARKLTELNRKMEARNGKSGIDARGA